MKKIVKIAFGLAALMLATPANAVVIGSFDQTPLAPLAQLAPTSVNNNALFDLNVTTSDGNHRSPWEFTACFNVCQYSSVRAGGVATYDFAQDQGSLNMMWGSPDPIPQAYNVMSFFLDGNPVGIFDGTTIAALISTFPVPNNQPAIGFLRVGFVGLFDRIVFSASNTAFEYVFNFRGSATPVPLPAGLMLLLSGLVGLGFMGRSRAKHA